MVGSARRSGPKLQARSAVSGRWGRLRRKSGTPAARRPYPLFSIGAAAPIAYPISCFDKRGHARIRFCMTKILTVRLPAGLHDKAEARAMRLGLDRAKYVRSLIEDDLSGARDKTQRVFASEDLVGLYQGDTGPATNASARERLRARAATRR